MLSTLHSSTMAVLAPRGRDAHIARDLLANAGIQASVISSLSEIPGLIECDIGGVLVAEEALSGPELSEIKAALEVQPSWSDVPFIVLTNGMTTGRSIAERERLDAMGNVLLLARPMHRDDIIHAAKSALKARARQFEARDRMEELRDQEEKLRASERKFHAIADSIDQMVWSTLPDGYHDYFNERWYEFTGVPAGSTDGKAWNGMFHRNDRARAWERWQHSLETGEPYEIEYRLRHRSGEYRWVLGKAQPVLEDDGSIARWYGTCTDIHEQVRVREELASSREVLEQAVAERTRELTELYRKTPVALHSLNGEGRITSVSDRWLNFLGYDSADEVIGRPITDFIAPDALPDHHGAYRVMLLEKGAADDLAYTCLKKSGERAEVLVSARVTLARDGEIERIMASVVDVTEKKKAEAARDNAEAALRQSQKLETIGQLTGGVAHDFNNLLMAIRSSLELLQRRLPEPDERAQSYLQNAIKATERGAGLTQRMLAFARKQELDPQPVNLGSLLQGMLDLLERSLGPQIEIGLNVAPDLPDALIDANQLEMGILNLALNARDAMQAIGRLELGADCLVPDGISDLGEGEYVRIRIADTGLGMDAETLARATEPFFTTKGVGRGTGLGLSMVHGLARQSGGAFRLESTHGEGTVAEIYLPVAEARYCTSEGPANPGEGVPLRGGKLTVLAVDDDVLVLMGTVGLLEDFGHRVLEATSGAQALELLTENSDIDLVVTDQAMPNMTGVELAKEIGRRRPGLPVVLASGYAEMPEGARDVIVARLEKPFSDKMLNDVICSVCGG